MHVMPSACARTLLASSMSSFSDKCVNGSFLMDLGWSDDVVRVARGLSVKIIGMFS